MSAPPRVDGVALDDSRNPYASENKWRHQESSKFAEAASPRAAGAREGGSDLATFLNKSRVAAPPGSVGSHKPIVVASNGHNGPVGGQAVGAQGQDEEVEAWHGRDTTMDVRCGPLLNYRRMENETWFGSVLVVTDGGSGAEESPEVPELKLKVMGIAKDGDKQQESTGEPNGIQKGEKQGPDDNENFQNTDIYDSGAYKTNGVVENTGSGETRVQGTKLYSDSRSTFWRFDLTVKMQHEELKCEYSIPCLHFSGIKTDKQHFFVPAIHDSMRIMFHSCNGFSVGTDEEAYSGACLWNDVLRVHAQTPFHVMLGGGDQIYNDGIRVNGPLKAWTDISNPHKRREFHFPESLRKDCDDYYMNNYIKWYSTEPFAGANGQIAQLNLWDDHDVGTLTFKLASHTYFC